MSSSDPSQALLALDALTRRLRRECPWDREQDERSIVPHTVEESYELADAAYSGDDARLLDELGDVLFQVVFLALLLEERGAGSLTDVAEHCRQKLIRRHPHVFADTEVADAAEVLRNWDAIKATEPGRERGVFGEIPENLPALLYARKLQRRAVSAGLSSSMPPVGNSESGAVGPADGTARGSRGTVGPADGTARGPRGTVGPADGTARRPRGTVGDSPEERVEGRQDTAGEDRESFHAIGERLFALVDEARQAHVDPELALRAAAKRYRERIGEQ